MNIIPNTYICSIWFETLKSGWEINILLFHSVIQKNWKYPKQDVLFLYVLSILQSSIFIIKHF